jgi:hypothetical protein
MFPSPSSFLAALGIAKPLEEATTNALAVF